MNNINIAVINFEQSLKNLIAQSGLPITVVQLILKNTQYEVETQKQEYLMRLKAEMDAAMQVEDSESTTPQVSEEE